MLITLLSFLDSHIISVFLNDSTHSESFEDTPLSLLPEYEAACESLMAILLFFFNFFHNQNGGEYWSSKFLNFWLIMRISNVRYTGCLVYWRNPVVYCEFIAVSNITSLSKILLLQILKRKYLSYVRKLRFQTCKASG